MKKTLNALIATALTCSMMGTSQGMENFHPLVNGSLPSYCTYPARCLTYFNTTDGLQYVASLNTTQNLMSPSYIASPMASPSANQEEWSIANYLSLPAIVTATIGIATLSFNILCLSTQ